MPDSVFVNISLVTRYRLMNRQVIYTDLVVLTLVVLEILSTFRIEVERVWKAKQTMTSMVFYFIRYVPPIFIRRDLSMMTSISYELKYMGDLCRSLHWVDATVTVAVQVLAEILMVMRVWTLYRRSKRMLVILGIIFIGGTTVEVWGTIIGISSIKYMNWPRENIAIRGCPVGAAGNIRHTVAVVFVYNMVSAGLMFLFMVTRCCKLARNSVEQSEHGTWRDMLGLRTALPLVQVLIRDGCLYFLIVFCASLMLIIVLMVNDRGALFTLPMGQAMYAIPTARIVLNLRDGLHTKRTEGGQRPGEIPMIDTSDMNFAARSSFDLSTHDVASILVRSDNEAREDDEANHQPHRSRGSQITTPALWSRDRNISDTTS